MQKTYRYLPKNKTILVADLAGFITEYRPVYQKTLQVYKGINNTLDFRLLNADQKPISLDNYDIVFVAFDENKLKVLEYTTNSNIVKDSVISGGFTVTINENDLLNIKLQYLSYSIYLVDSNNNNVLTYSDAHFGNNGIIKILDEAMPGPADTYSVTTFIQNSPESIWYSETLDAQPAINGNSALHTAVIYSDSYVGDIDVQATLDNQVTMNTPWANIATVSLNNETQPVSINFNGVFSHIRFKANASPTNTITKILVRN
jgi:hypothetical protein